MQARDILRQLLNLTPQQANMPADALPTSIIVTYKYKEYIFELVEKDFLFIYKWDCTYKTRVIEALNTLTIEGSVGPFETCNNGISIRIEQYHSHQKEFNNNPQIKCKFDRPVSYAELLEKKEEPLPNRNGEIKKKIPANTNMTTPQFSNSNAPEIINNNNTPQYFNNITLPQFSNSTSTTSQANNNSNNNTTPQTNNNNAEILLPASITIFYSSSKKAETHIFKLDDKTEFCYLHEWESASDKATRMKALNQVMSGGLWLSTTLPFGTDFKNGVSYLTLSIDQYLKNAAKFQKKELKSLSMTINIELSERQISYTALMQKQKEYNDQKYNKRKSFKKPKYNNSAATTINKEKTDLQFKELEYLLFHTEPNISAIGDDTQSYNNMIMPQFYNSTSISPQANNNNTTSQTDNNAEMLLPDSITIFFSSSKKAETHIFKLDDKIEFCYLHEWKNTSDKAIRMKVLNRVMSDMSEWVSTLYPFGTDFKNGISYLTLSIDHYLKNKNFKKKEITKKSTTIKIALSESKISYAVLMQKQKEYNDQNAKELEPKRRKLFHDTSDAASINEIEIDSQFNESENLLPHTEPNVLATVADNNNNIEEPSSNISASHFLTHKGLEQNIDPDEETFINSWASRNSPTSS